MKLLKSRGSSRAMADPDAGLYGTPADYTPSKPRRGLFDSFRKASNNNNTNNSNNYASSKVPDEDERVLLKKGSYANSERTERTEPTDAMTYWSETMSVASEEISTALNKTFAIINPPSFRNYAGHEVEYMGGSAAPSMDDEVGHFTNGHNSGMLTHASFDHLAAIETATNFSDPKNVQLRTQSLKIVEIHAEPRPSMEEPAAPTEVSAFQSEATFDPDKYLMEAESRQHIRNERPNQFLQDEEEEEEAEAGVEAEVGVEGDVKVEAKVVKTDNLFATMRNVPTGARTPSPNEEYISDASDDEEEEEEETAHKDAVQVAEGPEEAGPSPLHSVTSSGSTASSDWGKTSFGTREASLLDAVFNPDEDGEEADDDTFGDSTDDDDDGSTIDLEVDNELGTLDGDGTLEGPSSPQSQSSSVLLEEYDEIDGLAAFAGIFVNLVSCNFTDLASNILIDDEDDISVEETENQAAAANSSTNRTMPNLKSVADRVPTPPAPSMTGSLWSSFFGSCS